MQPLSRSLLCLPLFFVVLLNIPSHKADRLRSLIPWTKCGKKESFKEGLELENRQLRSQLEIAYDLLSGERRLKEEQELFKQVGADLSLGKIKREAALRKLRAEAVAIQASVVYRDPASWSSSCWIDVGSDVSETLVAKNSPVISGGNLVGVIEYVGRKQSRIRLITDSGLKVAVRAVRGGIQDRELALLGKSLLDLLRKNPKWHGSEIEKHLTNWEQSLQIKLEDFWLAKGEIRGSSAPIFRFLGSRLQGIGFNYEFNDEYGESCDLRSAIVQMGDLLVTSGLDGVFPQGLPVAIVSNVLPLRDGAFFYEIEADALAKDLLDLKSVFVLPPLPSE